MLWTSLNRLGSRRIGWSARRREPRRPSADKLDLFPSPSPKLFSRGSMSVSAESIRNRLVRGTGWVIVGKIGTFPLGLAVIFLLTRLLKPGQMGVYFLA